ncbi:MAG: ATP-binding protein [Oculatellaceae cyanobacterium bins.114]|nr:ATP-binding protein [Oculatellaceae cyanobacterium bins.114]
MATDSSISQPSNFQQPDLDNVLSAPSQAQQRRREQRVLEFLSSLSYRTGQLKTYLKSIAQGMNELIGLDWSVVTFCQDDAEQILASTIELDEAPEQTYSLHGTLTGTVIASGMALVVEDTTKHVEYGVAPEGYQAYLGVPLQTPTGAIIGTICSFQHNPRRFTDEEVSLAKMFAERAAIAIDNYHLYQQQQKFNQVLEAEVARRTQELSIAQAQLLEANNQLEQRIERRTVELRRTNEQLQAEIQERQQIEESLRQSEVRFRLLVENAGDAFLLLDPANGRVLDANQRACENLGYSYEELLERSTPDFDVRFTADELLAFRQTLVVSTPKTLESAHRRKDGTIFPVEATVCLFEAGGRSLELALVRDITERKQAEAAMARLAEIGELAAMIVHEVRNPLTTVLMGLTALRGVDLPKKAQLQLALALEDSERLQRLLNEILLYAKQQVLNNCELELNAFITELLEGLRMIPAIAEHCIQFIPMLSPVWIWGDRDKLKQVLINLMRNACEAVQSGEVITCDIKINPDQICIRVHNGGEPIPPDQLVKLGTPFFTTKQSGNGLGLAIVRRIVEAHGGQLVIQSALEIGTTVSVQLPLTLKRDGSSQTNRNALG